MSNSAVVLLSGGLDSTVSAFTARYENEDLYSLTFSYGQRHSKEVQSARLISDELVVRKHLKLELPLSSIGGSVLTGEGKIPTEGLTKGIPPTWVPQRNAIFLSIAFGWAEVLGCDKVYIGVNNIDYSGYPDCRPEFISAMNKALNLASKRYVETGSGITIVTPLIGMSKKNIVKAGYELGVPFSKTWSCYQGGEKACGVCDSCRIRLKAFEEAGLEDPIEYE